GASFFYLHNEHWRILAIDTGYNSVGWPIVERIFLPKCALPPQLLDWLRTTVKLDPKDPRGLILLSHHQYFSRYDDWYLKPAEQLAEFISRPVLCSGGTSTGWRSTRSSASTAASARSGAASVTAGCRSSCRSRGRGTSSAA